MAMPPLGDNSVCIELEIFEGPRHMLYLCIVFFFSIATGLTDSRSSKKVRTEDILKDEDSRYAY